MNRRLVGQRHMQLTNPLGSSAGMGLSATDLAGICTHARTASGKQLAQKGPHCGRMHAHRAHLHRMIGVTGNFKSP